MINYETFSKIHDCHDRQGLTIAQTAGALGLHPKTVATWVARPHFGPRRSRPRGSVLDPFKPRITRLLDTHPYSAQQIFQRLRDRQALAIMAVVDFAERLVIDHDRLRRLARARSPAPPM